MLGRLVASASIIDLTNELIFLHAIVAHNGQAHVGGEGRKTGHNLSGSMAFRFQFKALEPSILMYHSYSPSNLRLTMGLETDLSIWNRIDGATTDGREHKRIALGVAHQAYGFGFGNTPTSEHCGIVGLSRVARMRVSKVDSGL